MDFVIAVCIFIGVITWIFAIRTENPYGLIFYSLVASASFAIATYIKLST